MAELPEHVKKYGETAQRQWLHVYDSVYVKLGKENVEDNAKKERATDAANSVFKKRFTKNTNSGKNNQSDYFNYMVDDFVGNV